MCFDMVDFVSLESCGMFFDVIVYEMVYVIGFGILWMIDFFIVGS